MSQTKLWKSLKRAVRSTDRQLGASASKCCIDFHGVELKEESKQGASAKERPGRDRKFRKDRKTMICIKDVCEEHGRGECKSVNNATNEECVCKDPSKWSGKTDVLNFDGYSCGVNVQAEQVIYFVALFATTVLLVKHISALKHQMLAYQKAKAKSARRGKQLKWYEYPPLQVLAVSAGLGIPAMFVITIPKAFMMDSRQVGVFVPVTIGFILTGPVGFACSTIHELRSFDLVSRGSGLNKDKMQKLKRFMRIRYSASITWYGLFTMIALIFALFTSDQNPMNSPMRYFLVARNSSFMLYLAGMISINKAVAREAEHLVENMSKAPESAETQRARKVLGFLSAASKEKKKLALVVGTLYLIFSLPSLWHLQSIPIGVTIILTGLTKTHPVNSYMGHKKKSAATSVHTEGASTMNSSAVSSAESS